MKNIDFLPARYRDRDRHRRAFLRRMAIFGGLAVVLGAGHLAQLALRRAAEQRLQAIAGPHRAATALLSRLAQLRREHADNERFAELYTYLEHPWPRTQLLQAVTQTLPEPLALTELRIPHPPAGRPAAAENDAPQQPGPVRDLRQLRGELDGAATEVFLKGVAASPAALHAYVASFRNSSLFASANLDSLESTAEPGMPGGTRFELRLSVRPAYGQPGGPERPPPPPSAAVEQTASLDH